MNDNRNWTIDDNISGIGYNSIDRNTFITNNIGTLTVTAKSSIILCLCLRVTGKASAVGICKIKRGANSVTLGEIVESTKPHYEIELELPVSQNEKVEIEFLTGIEFGYVSISEG